MPRPLDGAASERLELSEYYADIEDNFARAREFWKLERGQAYAEPGDESWEAFDGGDWEESMRLIEKRREWLVEYFGRNAVRGLVGRRIRIVSLPPTPYLQWELYGLRLRDELGQATRILLDREVAYLEDHGPLPDLNLLDTGVMYQVIYDGNGVADHALRYEDKALVKRCRDFIAVLFERGEPIGEFFNREIAYLPPPHLVRRAIPHDYLEQAGRPVPPRSLDSGAVENAPRGSDAGETRSEIGNASIRGDVVQARDVAGGVHFHTAEGGSGGPRVVPRQLPADVSVFVNRQPEIRTLTRLTGVGPAGPGARPRGGFATVVVVTGSAGVGKTALALHWAHRVRDRFPDGELYANLRGFDEGSPVSAEVVLDRFLRDLGVAPDAIPADLDGRAALFRSLVADRRILVVLDNAADIGQVRPLVPGSTGPFVIITSRNQLPGLAIRDGARRIRLDIFQESDAVGLLRRVTRTGGRRDAPGDLIELAHLCARLPLALRVAAEHAVSRPTMQLAELIADLRDDSMLWDALSIGEGPHGEAVRTVFAWSYRDLSPDAARMFRALGLHSGPDISVPAAAAACGVPVRTARRALDTLVGAFLAEASRPGRYQLHNLLRAYALDQAREVDSEADRRDTIDRTLRWYIATASRACEALAPGRSFEVEGQSADSPDPLSFETAAVARDWFDTERLNLVAGARSAMESGLPRRAWEMAMVLGQIHAIYFTFDDWAVLSGFAITAADELGDEAALAAALDNRGSYLHRRGFLEDAKVTHHRALSIRRRIGDQAEIIMSLNALGRIGLQTRELSAATEYFADALGKARDIGNTRWEAVVRSNLAGAQLELGRAAPALAIAGPLPRYFASVGEPIGEGNALWLQSRAHRLLGDPAAALTAIGTALQIAEDAGNRMTEGFWLIEAAQVHLALGDTTEAMRCCRQAASLQRQIGDHSREAMALDCTGEVLLAMGNAEDASAFHREAARMHRQLGDRWQEALATIHLADAEGTLGQADASQEDAAHALELLQPFTDDRAAALKADLQTRLG